MRCRFARIDGVAQGRPTRKTPRRTSPMKKLGLCLVVLAVALVSAQAQEKKDDKKKGEKPGVTALPPHPLDRVFETAKTEKDVEKALLASDVYKRAVKEALKAKQEQEARFKKDKKFVGPRLEQAARQKFLEVLTGGK